MLNSKRKCVLQLEQQIHYQANPPYLILSFDENYFPISINHFVRVVERDKTHHKGWVGFSIRTPELPEGNCNLKT